MKILIIGGTGFIGPHLTARLVSGGHDICVFHRGTSPAALPQSVAHIRGDRQDLSAYAAEFGRFGPDVVVDMIAFTQREARSLLVTFRGLAGRLVVLSSGDVYRAYGVFSGQEPGPLEDVPLTEDAPLRTELYIARASASSSEDRLYHYEKILVERAVAADPELSATILRLPMVYGPGDYQHRLYPYLRRMDDARPVIPLDEGLAGWRCPRGYVENAALAIARAAVDPRAAGRVYNVAEPTAYTEAEWVMRIGQCVGWQGKVAPAPRGRLPVAGNTKQDVVMDSSRIRAELEYREEVPADEALRRTIQWERANPPAQPVDYAAEDALIVELGL